MITELLEDQILSEPDPETGLLIGPKVTRTAANLTPERIVLQGQYCRLEPIDADQHSRDLFKASTPEDAQSRFQYLPEPPPASLEAMRGWTTAAAQSTDPLFFAVIDSGTGRVEGRQSLLNIAPAHKSIEIGHIYWGPDIAGTRIATEANYLFAKYVFETLRYNRYEWKCNALNVPSRKAALRFGFTYEGHFRRALIVRGRIRDTSWFSIISDEWPRLKAAYEQWLDASNFDENGLQKTRLSDMTAPP